jgi:hypothetical protein
MARIPGKPRRNCAALDRLNKISNLIDIHHTETIQNTRTAARFTAQFG